MRLSEVDAAGAYVSTIGEDKCWGWNPLSCNLGGIGIKVEVRKKVSTSHPQVELGRQACPLDPIQLVTLSGLKAWGGGYDPESL